MNKEKWKPVIGHESSYLVSNFGNVMSLNYRKKFTRGTPSFLKNTISIRGYHVVSVKEDGKRRQKYVHRLVLAAFVGPRKQSVEVNHKNGIKTDNRLENLEYCTHLENMSHAFSGGLVQSSKGSDHFRSKIKENDVTIIRRLYAHGMTQLEIGIRFKMSAQQIGQILLGRAWRHVA